MNWDELVQAVADLSEDQQQLLIRAANAQRNATSTADQPAGAEPSPAARPAAQPDESTVQTVPTVPTVPAGEVGEVGPATPVAMPGEEQPTTSSAPDPTAASSTPSTPEPPPEVSRPAAAAPPPAASYRSAAGPDSELTSLPRDQDVPTLTQIREKIEGRAARAEGMTVLDAESQAGRSEAEAEQDRAKAARDVLERIRSSLHGQ